MLLYLSAAMCWILRLRLILVPDTLGCSGNGVMDACGQCVCNSSFFGNKCECEILPSGPKNMSASIDECTLSAVPNTSVCSGRGECVCGRCRCNPISDKRPDRIYSGKYCECGDLCPHYNDKICGGNGWCDCGKCVCGKDYTGSACECSTSVSSCFASNGQICNGRGSCTCGKCECETGSSYKGPTCEDCTPEIVVDSSLLCNSRGSLDSCGNCQCDKGYSGEFCECESNVTAPCIGDNSKAAVPSYLCKRQKQNVPLVCPQPKRYFKPFSSAVCSGRGECVCGMCSCFPVRVHSSRRYSGKYCQCDDYSCSYYDNMLCGGHGDCNCGVCVCHKGYSGEACECPLSMATCVTENDKICNGQGECKCGKCVCDRSKSYYGPLCEECPTCLGKCHQNKNCVRCRVFGTGPYTEEECQKTCPPVEIVEYIDEGRIIDDENSNLCKFIDDDDDLQFIFSYTYTNNFRELHLTAQKTKLEREGYLRIH